MLTIHGMGCFLPDTELTTEFLHQEVGLERDLEWVRSRLGIEKRYSVLSKEYILKTKNRDPAQAIAHARARGLTPVTMGIEAARRAIAEAGIRPDQVGWVIASNDTPFETCPSTACRIAEALGIGSGPHCDVNTACSSFARHMKLVHDSRESALPDFILCVQATAMTVRTDYGPKSIDAYVLGDGAAAEVLSPRHVGRISVEPLIFESDPADAREIVIDSIGHFWQNGSKVREFSIRKTCELFEAIAAQKGLYAETAFTVSHQVNYVMQNSVLGHLDLPEERHLRNVHLQGNIAGAGCPSVIAQNWGRFSRGDKIIYAVVGAGLAWGGGYMEILT